MNDISKDFRLFCKDKHVSMSTFDDVKKSIDNSLTPVVLEEREMNVTGMDIFSRLLYDRIMLFGHAFNSETCNIAIAELLYLNSLNQNDINIYINSPGGCVTSGLALIDTIDFIQSDVSTTCMGMAASMGAVLLSCGAKGKRFVLPHGRVMIHQPSTSMSGKYTDLEIELEQTRRCKVDLYKILANNLGKSFEEIEALCKDDNWFIGEENVELGIVDKVLCK